MRTPIKEHLPRGIILGIDHNPSLSSFSPLLVEFMVVYMWNGRGISFKDKQLFVNKRCKEAKVDVISLLETKANNEKMGDIIEIMGFSNALLVKAINFGLASKIM
jgi:hypothetical protein